MEDEILGLLIVKDEITWKSILENLVKSGEIDPWDVNITDLTRKYIRVLNKLKEMDLRIPGKVLLAAALLLKIKSNKLLDEDITEFDRMIASTEEMSEEDFYNELENDMVGTITDHKEDKYSLIPRMPQPRKRKVSIYDLIESLEKAFATQKRRIINNNPSSRLKIHAKSSDISLVIRRLYKQIVTWFKMNKGKLTFTQLLPSETKLDKVSTFIPLLHLDNQRRIDMIQKSHFGEINILLLKNARVKEVEQELGII